MSNSTINLQKNIAGICIVSMLVLLNGCAARVTVVHEPVEPDALTAPSDRVTDGAMRIDSRYFDVLQNRLTTLNANGTPINDYQLCKAQAWLDMAMLEYADNDRTGVIDAALAQSVAIIEPLEDGFAPSAPTPEFVWSDHVRDDLWQFVHATKDNDTCHSCKLAQLEVQLVWAGHEQRELGPRHARSAVRAAERLQHTIETDASCTGSTKETRVTLDRSKPRTRAIDQTWTLVPVELNVAKVIQFGLHEFALYKASHTTIRSFAAALHNNTELFVRLNAYSDEHGTASYSQSLAERRAKAVKDTLVEHGISSDRIATIAFGATHPDFSGSEALSQARNRRVEMLIFLIEESEASKASKKAVDSPERTSQKDNELDLTHSDTGH